MSSDDQHAWALAYRAEREASQSAILTKARASGALRRCRSCSRERWVDNRCLHCFDPPEIVREGDPTPMSAEEFRVYREDPEGRGR